MKSPLAYLILAVFWACLYLPGLGNREIRGEEWRRTLPARTMLNTGEWIVPWSGGLPYVRKPPLINWVSAASFKLSGAQNEWTARLPSALLTLGAALGIHAFTRRSLGGSAAFVGAAFFLTSVGCIEKGRLAEIEVYYIALTALAFSAWLAGFMGALNRWAAWLTAGLCLGLAFLAKGPMHLLFFYALVLGACWKTKRLRDLASAPHLAALALCIALLAAWAVPFMQKYGRIIEQQPYLVQQPTKGADVPPSAEPPKTAFESWKHEISSRVTGEEESSTKDWLVRGPRALVMFLPWALFIPLWWRRSALDTAFADSTSRDVFRGLVWGAVASFALMVLIPSSSPRYVAPLIGPVAILTAWIVTSQRTRFLSLNDPWRVVANLCAVLSVLIIAGASFVTFVPPEPVPPSGWQLGVLVLALAVGLSGFFLLKDSDSGFAAIRSCCFTMVACAFLMYGYTWLGTHISDQRDDVRPTGLAITEAMQPKDAPLHVFHLGQVPYVFYLPTNSIESYDLPQLPESGVRWMLTTAKVDATYRSRFESRYGPATKVGEWKGEWGAADQDINRNMVLLRFEGK